MAPVGRSSVAEAIIATMLTAAPNAHPTRSRAATPPPRRMPASAGTIRYENTRSTPAIRTELVTTTPKEA